MASKFFGSREIEFLAIDGSRFAENFFDLIIFFRGAYACTGKISFFEQGVNTIRDLQRTIKATAGGIIFATIQKFGKRKAEEYPFLTDRRNIVVIADEAHRSQYKELAMNLRERFPIRRLWDLQQELELPSFSGIT